MGVVGGNWPHPSTEHAHRPAIALIAVHWLVRTAGGPKAASSKGRLRHAAHLAPALPCEV